MRVLMINTEAVKGGAARAATCLAEAVQNQSSNLEVGFYHGGKLECARGDLNLKRRASRLLNAVITRTLGSHHSVDLGLAKEILKISGRADIVHLHNLHGYYLDYRYLLSSLRNKPLIWTWHDMWGATGRCAFSFECEGWRSGCGKCEHLDYYPRAWVDNASSEYLVKQVLYRNLSNFRIVTPSAWLRDIAVTTGFPGNNVEVIPNPINITNYRPVDKRAARRELRLPDQEFIALFVANDCGDPRKGYDHFVSVVKATGVYGVVVGRPPKVRSTNVRYVGVKNRPEELSVYYSAADALLLTSRADNYPNTAIESMACGTPVIGYDVGGVPSLIPKDYGAVVPANNLSAFIDAIKGHINAGGKSIEEMISLRKVAESTWSPQVAAERYVKAYKELVAT